MGTEPKDWDTGQIEAFARDASEEEIAEVLLRLLNAPDERTTEVLLEFLGTRNDDTFLKPVPSQLAARALISLGPTGVQALAGAIVDPDRSVRYQPAILSMLWDLSRTGHIVQGTTRTGTSLLQLHLPDGTQEAAGRVVRDIFAQALVDPEVFFLVTNFVQQRALPASFGDPEQGNSDAADLMGLFAEATIKLSRSALDEFGQLISEERIEEDYQRFLASNPVFLDPLAAEVIPKQRLGLEFATDYAIRRHDGRWLLVEIERPQDLLFTKQNDFRARFVHAFGQVLDFQSWVDENVAYAQKHMPEISAPRGIVIIGRRALLSAEQRQKVRHFADNSNRIEVITFDDLWERAESLYESLHRRRG